MKSSGCTTPRTGWRQRIRASTPLGEIERGLVDEEELVLLQGFAEIHLELHAVLDHSLHPRLEHDVAILAVPLGAVHRDVGVA
jgi:hypothetical protein